jgi:hypothetical protein
MKRVIAFFSALLFAFSALAGPFAAVASSGPYVGSYTFTGVPTCTTALTGSTARATDIGVGAGMALVCDGTRWTPDGVQILFRGSVPVGLAPSGTMANNGAVTLGTALPTIYTGGVYLHFPANAIVAGSAAGLYWTVMSSTTVGQVFNNAYTSGIPAAPTSTTPFVTTGPGAYTAATSNVTLITLTVPGGLMGINGSIDPEFTWSETNSANNKTHMLSFGGTNLLNSTLASVASFHAAYGVGNRGSASLQVSKASASTSGGGWGSNTVSPSYLTVNSASDVTLAAGGTKATATDWQGIETFIVRVAP